tara:strand:+ start:978 stop:1934 length:957 start_codon:yes stop_codon:yes gene_type:complete
MASIYHGRGAAVGIAEEDTWGTAKSTAVGDGGVWRPLISSGLTRTIEKVPRPTLKVGSAGAMRRAHFVQADLAGGTFSIEASYRSMGMLCKHLMGAVATSGTNPYTHVYTFADDVPLGLTIENVRGTGTSEKFEGCRLNSGTFAVSAGGVMTCEFDVIAQTSATRGSATTITYGGTDAPILHSQAGQFTFNGATYDLIDMSLVVNNALATRQHLGSAVTAKPLRSDFQSVEMSITVEVEDALYAAFIADTESDAHITFTDGTRSFRVDLENAYLSTASDPVSDANVIRQTITLIGQSDGTNEGLKLTVINGDSTGIGN